MASRSLRSFKSEALPIIALCLALAVVPPALGFNQYYILLAATSLLFAVMVVAWNIIGGYAGQLDLAPFAYVGIGGIVAAQLLNVYGVTPWIGMFVGAGAAAGLALAVGYPTFRFGIKEVWYALLTASLVVILNNIMHLPQFLGPMDHYLPSTGGWFDLIFPVYQYIYYIILVALAITMYINVRINNSKTGYYLKAIREDELAAEALGIDVRKYKLKALITYASILGFIGYLYLVLQTVYSYATFDSAESLAVAIMGIIGGLGSIGGAFTAAVILKTVEEYLRGAIGATIPGIYLLIYGILLIVVGIFKPEGLAGVINWGRRKLMRRRGGGGG